MLLPNLLAYITAHGCEASIIGGVIAVRIPCTLKTAHTIVCFTRTEPVASYAQARAVLGY